MKKKVFYNGLADFSLLFAGILSSVILARLLGPQQWGEYSQMMWLISFLGMLANFGLTYTSIRFVANLSGKEDKTEIKPLLKWIFIVQLLLAIANFEQWCSCTQISWYLLLVGR